MTETDYEFALLLQEQFNHEIQIDNPSQNVVYNKPKRPQNSEKSLTDPSWELIDPTPNVYILFVAFNEKYFWNKLVTVSVSWSKRMTSCAGICSYQGRGGLCHITLSEPLLKLRPRKDLIETLLHEMIHAFLFVTHNDRDRDGHGPEFHKHMYRINAEAGTNITVYHSFHDEVRLYKQHWWKCNGPCQHQQPYYGMVKRAMNRAPGPNDNWWNAHQQNCGGTFIKIKEPEKYQKKKSQKQNENVKERNDIRNFYPLLNQNTTDGKNGNITHSVSDINETILNESSDNQLHEITNDNASVSPKKPLIKAFDGVGRVLSASSSQSADYSVVRNAWLNKFSQSGTLKRTATLNPNSVNDNKLRKIEKTNTNSVKVSNELTNCPICNRNVPIDQINSHLDLCLSKCDKDDFNSSSETSKSSICNKVLANNFINDFDDCMIVENKVYINNNCKEKIKSNGECGIEKKYNCPVCFKLFFFNDISSHMDICLKNDNTNLDDSLVVVFDEPF